MGQQINVEIVLEKDFTQVPNLIISGKEELSWDACTLLTKCAKNKSGWVIDWGLFEEIHGISKQRRITALKELKDKRYCVEKTYMEGKVHCYVYYFSKLPIQEELVEYLLETPYEQIPKILDTITIEKILKIRISQSSKRDCVNEIAKTTPYSNNIISNNINLNNTNKKQAEINFRSGDQEDFLNNINHEHETCSHDSTDNDTFSNKLDQTQNNMENLGGDINRNISSSSLTIPKKPQKAKSTRCIKGLDADGNATRNKLEVRKAQGESAVDNIISEVGGKALGKQTATEQEISQMKKATNEVKQAITDLKSENAKALIRKNTKTKRKDKISKLVKEDFQGDLQNAMLNYIDFFIESGKKMLEGNYRALVQKLDDLSKGDNSKKLEIVNNSLRNCWLDFYDVKSQDNTNNKKSYISKTSNPQFQFIEEDEDPYWSEIAKDENGNELVY